MTAWWQKYIWNILETNELELAICSESHRLKGALKKGITTYLKSAIKALGIEGNENSSESAFLEFYECLMRWSMTLTDG